MSEYTPGPWEVSEENQTACVQTKDEYVEMTKDGSRPRKNSQPYKAVICWFSIFAGTWKNTGIEARANARLISAAPDLLEACEELLKYENEIGGILGLVRAAIAKAKGAA